MVGPLGLEMAANQALEIASFRDFLETRDTVNTTVRPERLFGIQKRRT